MKRPDNINDAQWQAVIHPSDYLLITAGPGTGKTHTLTYRIIHFFSKLQTNQKILAITFTNKAAQEMRQRLKSYFGKDPEAVTIGTFHKFCLSCLREFVDLAGLPKNFQIASELQKEILAKQIWPDKPKQMRERLNALSREKSVVVQAPSQDLAAFDQKLRENTFLDFDDILQEAFKLFKNNAQVRKELQKRYRYVFVDEYQDTNDIQHEILKLLVGEKVGLTVIGDPHQAIYGFRGSNVSFFHQFTKDFPGAQTLSLSENYRSAQNLLEAAGQIISKDESLKVPSLTANIYKEGRLVIHETPTERAEAEYVVRQVEKMVGGTSMFSKDSKRVNAQGDASFSFGDIAVLYRLNSQRKALEEAFVRSGIPFQVSGNKALSEEKEVAGLMPKLVLMREKPIEDMVRFLQGEIAPKAPVIERLIGLAKAAVTAKEFLDDLFLQRENDRYVYNVEKVSLLTLHAAKGLEFSVVFIVGCEDGLVPLRRDDKKTDLEEERRLFYVGMTRAKTCLFLTWGTKRTLYGKTVTSTLSPFVLDIEERLKEYEKSLSQSRKRKDMQLKFESF
ncbi:MAG: ATP-dependent helicase [Candidatus Omnitrophica bacterium]|nr:ATP-dependent helicase [Candidatus Omnitrophota bacterium]